jgi:ketosteroid isomerase-like protein
VTYTQDAFTTPSGQVMPKGQTRISYVFAKSANQWQVAHGHNVRIDAEAALSDPINRPKK